MEREKLTEEERSIRQDSDAIAEYDGEKSNRAKVIEHEGDDYVDIPAEDKTIEGKIKNFWYHYKWHTVATVLVALFLFIGITQMSSRAKYDVSVMYAGPAVVSGDDYTALSESLSGLLGTDFDKNGKKFVYVYPFTYMTDEQVAAEIKKWEEAGIHDVTFDKKSNEDAHSSFNNMVFAGECGVMFLDESLFEQVRDAGGLVTLESALGERPEGALDEYGIRLSEVDAYGYFPSLQIFPEDTVLCLRGPSTVGGVFTSKKNAEKTFNKNKEYFIDIMSFKVD